MYIFQEKYTFSNVYIRKLSEAPQLFVWKSFAQTEHSWLFTIFTYILHACCLPPLPPPPQFLLGITLIPRQIEDNGYAKFWEVNKVSGLSESGE